MKRKTNTGTQPTRPAEEPTGEGSASNKRPKFHDDDRSPQLLCRVQRSFDQEPGELKEDGVGLQAGDVVAMGGKPEAQWRTPEAQWRTYPEDRVTVSEEGLLATQKEAADGRYSLTTTGEELTEGRHYWEVEIADTGAPLIGVCRVDVHVDHEEDHSDVRSTTGWFMNTWHGMLGGNGKEVTDDMGEGFEKGDRVGVLLDLDDGSLRFFKNGEPHLGYPAGSVEGPVTLAAQMFFANSTIDRDVEAVRLLHDAKWPAGHSPPDRRLIDA